MEHLHFLWIDQQNSTLVDGFNMFQPLWNIWVNWDDYSQYREKCSSHHQPAHGLGPTSIIFHPAARRQRWRARHPPSSAPCESPCARCEYGAPPPLHHRYLAVSSSSRRGIKTWGMDVASIFFHWQFEHDLVLLPLSWLPSGYLTWPCKIDENGPFLDDFPKTSIYSGFSMAMLKNQMVTFTVNVFSWNRWNMAMSVETIQESTSYDSHLDRQW